MSTASTSGIIAVGVCLPVLSAVFLGLRLGVRIKRKTLGIDDALVIFGWIITAALGIMMIVGGAEHALAAHTPTGPGPDTAQELVYLVISEKMRFVSNLLSTIAFGAIKLSLLFFYRRIWTVKIFHTFHIVSLFMIAIVVAWTLGFALATIFTCGSNVWAFWSPNHLDLLHYCPANDKIEHGLTISDVLTDIMILALPIPMVMKLHMPRRQRVALIAVFLTGGVAVAAGITRLANFYEQTRNTETKTQGNQLVSSLIYWSEVELGMSIVAACLPVLKPLLADNQSVETFINRFQHAISLASLSFGSRNRSQKGIKEAHGNSASPDLELGSQADAERRAPSSAFTGNSIPKSDPYLVERDLE